MLVLAVLAFMVFLFIVGSGVDYGFILVEDTKLQNAVDSASLAGARGMRYGTPTGVAAAQTAAESYLNLQGYSRTNPAGTPDIITYSFTTPTPSGQLDTMQVQVTRSKPTVFWRILGINSVPITRSARAVPVTSNILSDVVLALDETGSMSCCGAGTDIAQMRSATLSLINNPNLGVANGSGRIALVQFNGLENPEIPYTWGRDNHGQNGDGSISAAVGGRTTPTQISSLSGTCIVAAGGAHGLALASNAVWSWGANGSGQLGRSTGGADTGTPAQVTAPVGLPGPTFQTVDVISAGGLHSMAMQGSNMYVWGANNNHQVNSSGTTTISTPISVSLPGGAVASGIAGGGIHSMAYSAGTVSTSGVYTWGGNTNGQIGPSGSSVPSDQTTPVQITLGQLLAPANVGVTAVAAGGTHSMALLSNGTVRTWGENTVGQLGNGSSGVAAVTAVQTVPGLTGVTVTKIAAGGTHSLAMDSLGRVWAWGEGSQGQLGDNTATDRPSPVQVQWSSGSPTMVYIEAGWNHSLAIDSNGRVWAWGSNTNGQIGDTTNTQRNRGVQLSSSNISNIQTIAAGGNAADGGFSIATPTCQPDTHILLNYTSNLTTLTQAVNGPSGGCPGLPAQPPYIPPTSNSSTYYMCPLVSHGGTGTYHDSPLQAVFRAGAWNYFDTSNGARAAANKVLIIETDGSSQAPGMTTTQGENNSMASAARTKLGSDGINQTVVDPTTLKDSCNPVATPIPCDDIQIRTVGFYDIGSNDSALDGNAANGYWPLCPFDSSLSSPFAGTAPTAANHPNHPGNGAGVISTTDWNNNLTSTDRMMIQMSSSPTNSAGLHSCMYYYPSNKGNPTGLQTAFDLLAQTLNARGAIID